MMCRRNFRNKNTKIDWYLYALSNASIMDKYCSTPMKMYSVLYIFQSTTIKKITFLEIQSKNLKIFNEILNMQLAYNNYKKFS